MARDVRCHVDLWEGKVKKQTNKTNKQPKAYKTGRDIEAGDWNWNWNLVGKTATENTEMDGLAKGIELSMCRVPPWLSHVVRGIVLLGSQKWQPETRLSTTREATILHPDLTPYVCILCRSAFQRPHPAIISRCACPLNTCETKNKPCRNPFGEGRFDSKGPSG